MISRLTTSLVTIILFTSLGLTQRPVGVSAASVPVVISVSADGNCLGMPPYYTTPKAAVDAASAGSIIRIATGNYPVPAGQAQALRITQNLKVQGGFRPTDRYDPPPYTFPTALNGGNLVRAVLIDGNPAQTGCFLRTLSKNTLSAIIASMTRSREHLSHFDTLNRRIVL